MKRLATTKDGKLTYCTASEENIGKGRCNHIYHQNESESQEDFMKRANEERIKSSSLFKSFEEFNSKEKSKREKTLSIINDKKPKEELVIAVLKAEKNISKAKETYFNTDNVLDKFLDIKENGSESEKEFIDDDIKEFKHSMHSIVEYGMFIMNWDSNAEKMKSASQDSRDYREKLVQMDHTRKSKHDAVITAIKLMNNICDSYNISPAFYSGKVDKDSITREEIGNHILQLISNRTEYLAYL